VNSTSALSQLPDPDLVWVAIPLAILIYALLLYDARRAGSPTVGDDQLGLKTVAAVLAIAGTWVFAEGLGVLLLAILTFDDFGQKLKTGLPSFLVGAAVVIGAGLVLFSRTNAAQYPRAKRLAAGIVAIYAGVALVPALVGLLLAIFDWPSWRVVAAALARVIDVGLVFAIAMGVLAKLSGLVMPTRMPAPGTARPGGPPSGPPGGMGQPLGGVVQPVQTYPAQPAQGYAAPPMQPLSGQPLGGQPVQTYPVQPMQPVAPGYAAPTQPPVTPGYPPQQG
jgi:hypothetical protein